MASLVSTEVIKTYSLRCPHQHRKPTGTIMCNVIIRQNSRDEIIDVVVHCEVAEQEGRQDRT